LTTPLPAEERLDHTEHLRRIPFRAAFDPAEHSPSRSIRKLVGRPVNLEKGVPDVALLDPNSLDRLEPELGDKRLTTLLPAAILGYGNDSDPVAEARLQAAVE